MIDSSRLGKFIMCAYWSRSSCREALRDMYMTMCHGFTTTNHKRLTSRELTTVSHSMRIAHFTCHNDPAENGPRHQLTARRVVLSKKKKQQPRTKFRILWFWFYGLSIRMFHLIISAANYSYYVFCLSIRRYEVNTYVFFFGDRTCARPSGLCMQIKKVCIWFRFLPWEQHI